LGLNDFPKNSERKRIGSAGQFSKQAYAYHIMILNLQADFQMGGSSKLMLDRLNRVFQEISG
jgi:hypothetical protein